MSLVTSVPTTTSPESITSFGNSEMMPNHLLSKTSFRAWDRQP